MTRKDIPGFEGKYAADIDGKIWSHLNKRHLKLQTQWAGYKLIGFSVNGKSKSYAVHKLIANAWLGPSNGLQVNHKDGDKSNNSVDNLEYITALENIQHSWSSGLSTKKFGEDTSGAKLTDIKVINIRHMYRSGIAQRVLAKLYNVDSSNIHLIVNNKRWKHI